MIIEESKAISEKQYKALDNFVSFGPINKIQTFKHKCYLW